MSYSNTIVNAASMLDNVVEPGGMAWTALCDLQGTVGRLTPTYAAIALQSVMALYNVIGRLDDDQAARAIVGCEALIQGLCPKTAWADWCRLNGC